MWDNLIFQKKDEKTLIYAKLILENLDENYYFSENEEFFCRIYKLNKVFFRKTLLVIQNSEPFGVATKDLHERILIICRNNKYIPIKFILFIENNWEGFQKKNFPSSILKYTTKKIKFFYEKIENQLHEFRIRNISIDYIYPDVIVTYNTENKNLKIKFNHKFSQDIEILKIEKAETSDEFYKNKIKDAEMILKSVLRRENTLSKIIEYLTIHQQDFFEHKTDQLHQISILDISEKLKLHPSTIYRSIQNKYLEFEKKMYPLAEMIPKTVHFKKDQKINSEKTSDQTMILNQLKQIIQNEDKTNPFSDEKIAQIFQEKENVSLSRRVIVKYREKLNISNSQKRKIKF